MNRPDNIELVTEQNKDDWGEKQPINPLFKIAFRAIIQLSDLKSRGVYIDFERPHDEKNSGVGVFTASFDGWKATVNWTPEKRGSLPPNYIAIEFHDSVVGIIGPYATIRTCHRCGLSGFSDPERTKPCLKPSFKGRDGVWYLVPCPNCEAFDWMGQLVMPEDFLEAAISATAQKMNRDRLWKSYDGDSIHAKKELVV